MATAERKASPRATEVWRRLCAWYGARFAEQYGAKPPPDWCATIDAASRDAIDLAFDEIRVEHPVYPPTFPEFDAIVAKHSRIERRQPSMHERLGDFVVRHRKLTRRQQVMPWTYHVVEGRCVCVDIPDDGDTPGFRVRLADLPTSWEASP